ncbi:MAG: DUF3124 domain-containing protein, partial [Xanthobacteraceae bacterium]
MTGKGLAGALMLALAFAFVSPARCQTSPSLEQAFANALTPVPAGELNVTGAFYVPAYSSVLLSQGKLRVDFAVTLSIHNASQDKPLVLRRLAYFDGNGKLVEEYLKQPVALKPFATVEVYIPEQDVRAGTGANFLVDWASIGDIAEPVIEA